VLNRCSGLFTLLSSSSDDELDDDDDDDDDDESDVISILFSVVLSLFLPEATDDDPLPKLNKSLSFVSGLVFFKRETKDYSLRSKHIYSAATHH
jgi:hypothetical protein